MPLFGGAGMLYWNNIASAKRANSVIWSAALVYPISQGYFGIGLPTNVTPGFGHFGSDMILAVIDPANNVVLSDRWSTSNSLPDLDTALGGEDNLIFPQGIVTPDGQLYIKFRRLFVTGDPFDTPISIVNFQRCQFAFSPFPGLLNHGRANRETQVCNFGNVSSPTSAPAVPFRNSLVVAHAVLGAFGIGLFLTFGGFLYRYLWCLSIGVRMWVSGVFFLLGGVLVIISFIIACAMVAESNAVHFSFDSPSHGAHGILALVTMIAVVAFLLIRFVADCALKPSRVSVAADLESEKAQFYRLASFGGWALLVVVVLVGWPTIFVGFVDNATTFPWLWVVGAILIFIGCVFIIAEIIRCIKGPKRPTPSEEIEMRHEPPH
jgi:hypothetical protein